jgi:uncharacterized membrane protein YfcA/rhodanese-related sulfurtransferase
MEIAGYLAASLIGLSLGLIGGGGSILTVPVLVYLFGETASQATAYSLFIVGLTALIGSFSFMRKGQVDFRTALVFGPPSILAVYLVRGYVVPNIPKHLFSVGSFEVTRDKGILFLFAIMMVATAFSMIRSRAGSDDSAPVAPRFDYLKIMVEGLVVGAVTGLVGGGGGFLIIPALVLLAKLPMKIAVGTSLLIIAAKSLLGFIGDVQTNSSLDWGLLGSVSALAVLGILVGSALSARISGAKLKPAFGYFVLVMGAFMIGRELLVTPASASAHLPYSPHQPEQTQTNPNQSQTMTYKNINPKQLQERLAASPNLVLLDVRESEERDISKLPNDVHIPMGEIQSRLEELDPNAEIVVYCRTGNRSGSVAQYMAQLGFKNVSNLAGGINLWSKQVDPTVPTY